MKKLVAALLVGTMVFSLTACGSSSSTSEDTSTTEDTTEETTEDASEEETTEDATADSDSKGIIAYSCYNMGWEYYVTLSQGVQDAAEAAGYEYVNVDQESDQSKMIQQCTDLINQGIACLVLTPCKPEAVSSIYEAAEKAGVPVVLADIGTDEQGYMALLKSDNYDGGCMAGDYVVEKFGENGGKFATITVDPSNTNIVRTDGFADVMKEAGWEEAASLAGNSEPDEAYSCMQDILTANPDVKVVFCGNDPMAISAAQAVADAGLTPGEDVYVIGYDAQSNVFEPIENGEVLATVAQDPYGMGSGAVEVFLNSLDGEEPEFDDADTKLIYTDQWIIDADNAADYE